jgi:DNA-directed RNA polymerase specialized sigma24 family protein
VMTDEDFERFVVGAEPRLRRALLGAVGVDRLDDAVSEAMAFAYERWGLVSAMDNPIGYLFRVGQSKTRQRKIPHLFRGPAPSIPDVEPRLTEFLLGLPRSQRTAVWLAHGCGWTHAEIGAAMEISSSTVATHVSRGLDRLRENLGAVDDRR